MVISIDIGTSYSTLCFLNSKGKAEPVEISTGVSVYGDKFSLPSAVFVDDEGEIQVGQAAMKKRALRPQNFRMEFKRNLGQNFPIVLGDKSFLPEDLYTRIFRHMLVCFDNKFNQPIEKAYITYPASFGAAKQEKIKKAANDAGIFNTELISEPSAAAMCYGASGNLKEDGLYMVYDFGGGTFDTALVQYENGNITQIGTPMGIEHCGGSDIDRLIYEDIKNIIPDEVSEQLSGNKTAQMRFEVQLAELAVQIKHQLTFSETAEEGIQAGFDSIEYKLTREKLNSMIAGMIEQTVDCCRNLLSTNKKSVNDLSGILLVGGTSRIPLVRDMLKKMSTDAELITVEDPELSVAQGAVVYNKVSEFEDYPEGIRDVVRLALLGDAEAQVALGKKYYDGQGVQKDFSEAFKWTKKAAVQGHMEAQYSLGSMYYYGDGVEQNTEKALKWLNLSAEQGHSEAQEFLDDYNREGKTPKAEPKAHIIIVRSGRFVGAARTVVVEIEGYKYYITNSDSYKEISVDANAAYTIGLGYKNLISDGDDITDTSRFPFFLSDGDRLTIDVTIDREKIWLNGEVFTSWA